MTSALILAGGLGTRLRSVVTDVPKPMAPVAGRPFLEYLMDYWIAQGIDHFVLSIGYKSDLITKHFGSRYANTPVDYAVEKTPLGTGGGLLLGLQEISQERRVLVLNGDTFFEGSLQKLESFADKRKTDWCISLYRSRDTERYMGIELADTGEIVSLNTRSRDDECLINAGVYLVSPDSVLGQFPIQEKLSLEADILPQALARGQRLYGLESIGRFIDIGIPEDYQRAAEILAI